jgi:type VI secretion system secreted protein VgrG
MALNDLNESRRFDFSLANQGSPTFGVVQLEGTEAISQPYRFDLMLVSESPNIDFDAVLQDTATLTIFSQDGLQAHKYHGVILEFEQLSKINKFFIGRSWCLALVC